jgi:hypothetical protein
MRTAYHFFLAHAGTSYDPATETPAHGRRRGARELAAAERWAEAERLAYVWEDDPYCSADDFELPDDQAHVRAHGAVQCTLLRPCPEHGPDCRHAEPLGSLCGITESLDNGERDSYRRVVQAELALTAMREAR